MILVQKTLGKQIAHRVNDDGVRGVSNKRPAIFRWLTRVLLSQILFWSIVLHKAQVDSKRLKALLVYVPR